MKRVSCVGMSSRLFLLLALATAACPPHDDASTPDAGELAEASAADAEAFDAADAAPVEKWQDAVREERWSDALAAMGAPYPNEAPMERLARALALVETGEGEKAQTPLTSLESALPLLGDMIARLRARAQAISGPFASAGDWFAKQSAPADWLEAARAYEKGKDAAKARAAAARVVTASGASRAQQAEARALRVRVGGGSGKDDTDDTLWLFAHAADLPAGAKVDAQAMEVKPDAAAWLSRAPLLAAAGKVDDAILALDRGHALSHANLTAGESARQSADMLMKARVKYAVAAQRYGDAAKEVGPHTNEDLLSQARALSRNNQDAAAIAAYDDLVKASPRAPQADEATFLAARLVLLSGKYADAAKRLDDYDKKFPRGAEKKEATRLRGIAHLVAGDDVKLARKLLESASGAEKDEVAQARLAVLAAAAAYVDGDKAFALARWTDVAKSVPLTWPALVARARLASLGAPVPAAIEPGNAAASAGDTPALPPVVSDLHDAGLDGYAEDALRAREAAVTGASRGHTDEALCKAYGAVGRAERRFQIGTRLPRALLAKAPDAATRWAWECMYPTPFPSLISRLEKDEKLPAGLITAVMRQESGFDHDVVSPAGAVGLMQLMPETAATTGLELGIPITDADLTTATINVRLGARFLRTMIARVGAIPLAVAAYNAGPDAIERWALAMSPRESPLAIDIFVEAIPYQETREYVSIVMGNFARYAYLSGGEDAVPKIDVSMPK